MILDLINCETDETDALIQELQADIPIEKVKRKIQLSADSDSTFKLIADALSWSTVLKAAATVYLSQLAKNAADATWKNKDKALPLLKSVILKPLNAIAKVFVKTRSLQPGCQTQLVLAVENSDLAGVLTVKSTDPAEAAWIIAQFVLKAEITEAIITALIKDGVEPYGFFRLELLSDDELVIKWIDHDGKRHQKNLN